MDLEIATAQKLQAGGDLVIKKGLMPAAGVLQTATGPVLVKGDIRGGVQVKVGHDLIVKGAVVGDSGDLRSQRDSGGRALRPRVAQWLIRGAAAPRFFMRCCGQLRKIANYPLRRIGYWSFSSRAKEQGRGAP